MGRGDKKTKKGKISKGSYGVSRPARTKKAAKKAAAKK
jgi:30S ribosomal protein S31